MRSMQPSASDAPVQYKFKAQTPRKTVPNLLEIGRPVSAYGVALLFSADRPPEAVSVVVLFLALDAVLNCAARKSLVCGL